MKNQCRIIGGRWRGRKITFPDLEQIRPTPDRVRETLFNWLMHDIQGAICLDPFAGSGALGFEALSRGAEQVTLIEQSREICQHLKRNGRELEADNLTVWQGKSPVIFSRLKTQFDIVFLDPPFEQGLVQKACRALQNLDLLKPEALIYIEVEKDLEDLSLPETWQIVREKVAGLVKYLLIRAD